MHHQLEKKKLACTNTINCPFFQNGNIDLNKLIVKKNLDDSNSEMNQISKTSTRVSGINWKNIYFIIENIFDQI
jgi:hypothetical protein